MSGLVDRITAVQQAHRYAPFTGICPCGFRFDTRDGHDAHVAAAVAAELQLTEEWAHKGRADHWDACEDDELDEWSCGHTIVTPTRHGVVHEGFEMPVRRWVSAWSEVQP